MSSHTTEHPANNEPLVSIVLPCYNSQRYLRETLDSVRNQSYSNWELIAVDDCSSDQTLEILQAAVAQDPRIRLILREERGGKPSITKNTGLQHARGEYIAFIDHDDNYLPGKLATLVSMLERHADHVAAFHDLEYIDAQGLRNGTRYIPDFINHAAEYISRLDNATYSCDRRFPIFQVMRYSAIQTTSCLLAKARLPHGFIAFDTQYTITDDKDLWVRLALQGRLAFVNQVHGQYRVHSNNLSNDTLKTHRDVCKLLKVNIQRLTPLATKKEKARLKDQLAQSYAYLGWAFRCNGMAFQATASYLKSMALRPSRETFVALLKSGFKPKAN